jgi:hypothetical protein
MVEATRGDARVETGERRAGWMRSCVWERVGTRGNSSRPRAFASSGMNRRLGEVGHPFIPRAREAVGARGTDARGREGGGEAGGMDKK